MQARSIFVGSPEWNYAQFRLQLILSHPNIEIISIQKNPSLQNLFESKQSYFKIDAAIDVTYDNEGEVDYYKSNSKKGSIFKCGRVEQQCKFTDGLGNPKLYRMLLFKIAVKNLLPIYHSSSITKDDLQNFTQEYDSVYITTRKQQLSVYDHQYFLKSTSQYFWQFDIQYRYVNANQPTSRVKKWSSQTQKCQECLNNKAYWYCVEEKLLFCRQCFEQTHKGKYRNPHQKQMLSPLNCFKKCHKAAHNQNPLQFYCFNCKSLKCSKCLADTSHGLNKYHSHEGKLFQRSSESVNIKRGPHQYVAVRQLIKILQQRQQQATTELKKKLIQKIDSIQAVITLKSKKYNQKLKQLQQNLALAIFNLKKQSRKQINEAVSIQVELKRKFDEVLWIEKFVSYNQEALDAESNIQLKQVYASYVGFMNAEQYFKRIDQKVLTMRKAVQ